jgi:NTE family protein
VKPGPVERLHSDPKLSRYLPKVVYVLSGGAAKGFCHVGMIAALEKRGILPDLIVGTSAGSLIGALYSHFGTTADLVGRIEEVLASSEFLSFEKKYFGERAPLDGHVEQGIKHFLTKLSDNFRVKMHLGMSLITQAMVSKADATSLFEKMFEGVSFDTLKIPFASVTVDLTEGQPAVFRAGNEGAGGSRTIDGSDGLMRAVMASCAIPLVFPAVAIGDSAFADGSIMANLPIREARALLPGQNLFVAGFDVLPPAPRSEERFSSVELALRLLDLATRSKQYADRELADILFEPLNADFPWSSFAEYKNFIELGRAYMTDARLDAFETMFAGKSLAKSKEDPNPIRGFLASRRIERVLRER